jgi:hypothetical protein
MGSTSSKPSCSSTIINPQIRFILLDSTSNKQILLLNVCKHTDLSTKKNHYIIITDEYVRWSGSIKYLTNYIIKRIYMLSKDDTDIVINIKNNFSISEKIIDFKKDKSNIRLNTMIINDILNYVDCIDYIQK